MKKNKVLISLIRKNKGKAIKFKDLQPTAKYAMAHYMAIDGEAWELSPLINKAVGKSLKTIKNSLIKSIGFYTKLYGNKKFGFVNLPTQEFLSFFYNGSYPKAKELHEKRKVIWPIIISLNEVDEYNPLPVEDGWHRLSDYVTMGLKTIPCLYYLESQKYF